VKYLDEFRDPRLARMILKDIQTSITRKWVIMEICGGQTHSIIKNGIDQVLPDQIELVHGPGCPVCVTPLEFIDKAIEIAGLPNVIFTSFGDMLRVPGSKKDLLTVKSEGADIRTVYSPLESIKIARENPEKEVVFFAVGFETTAPGNAMAIYQAEKEGLKNYFQLVSHVLVPPAMRALLSSATNRVQGYLAAGHVCTVMGLLEYKKIADEFKVPIVATGFEPLDILSGILKVVKQLETGRHEVENEYSRVVTEYGNIPAQELIKKVYTIINRKWRGIGEIPVSGLGLSGDYADFDAETRFAVENIITKESELCISGIILQGLKKPYECSAFGKECTPAHPLGATMVSSEGACAAYYKYQQHGMKNL
jgi:hydrogenase expression/formation protein HypD